MTQRARTPYNFHILDDRICLRRYTTGLLTSFDRLRRWELAYVFIFSADLISPGPDHIGRTNAQSTQLIKTFFHGAAR